MLEALHRWMHDAAPADGPIGVAVSGGGDSVALMLLLHDWAATTGRALHVATVDHGLRPESAAEADLVAARAARLGLPHQTLQWSGAPQGNLQDAARQARTELLADWAGKRGLAAVALGHTRDDQAETLLLRLARGSGIDGLSAMAPVSRRAGVTWLRPLLGQRRQALRDWLSARGEAWVDDPSNTDPRFDRVRMRALLPALEDLGLGVERLAGTADKLRRARHALERATAEAAARVIRPLPVGALELDRPAYRDCPAEIRLRLLASALCWIGSAPYRPRLKALEDIDKGLTSPDDLPARGLHGCLVQGRGATALITREPAACGPPVRSGAVWDGAWRTGPSGSGLTVAPLGEAGLRQLPDWREAGLPRAALLPSPAFWRADALIAAPFAMRSEGCHVSRVIDWTTAVAGTPDR
ncbi:tRNA lysidine(34) synthetase TilS [Oceanibium sediminis]|uniref:tRNA lysidine(34) synthetase TilS n=1 Tax=Oceanibium sediminis TaxID=2026339 RepID=UPI000DD42459|nr:tRNA lysidine(34) synthetase TilS [Oceanibium sediminis]